MKSFLSYFLPLGAGTAIMFFILPEMGGNLELFVQKMAIEWEIPIIAVRIILTIAVAIVLCFLFGILAKVALWAAIVVILVAVFAPAALKDLPIISEDEKNVIIQKIEELKKE